MTWPQARCYELGILPGIRSGDCHQGHASSARPWAATKGKHSGDCSALVCAVLQAGWMRIWFYSTIGARHGPS